MGRDSGHVCKRCRREAMKLFLKGERCFMAKCPIETGRAPPGMHGAARRGKPSDYGLQLREKQRLKRAYGLRDGQFRVFFKRALGRRGITGEALLQSLEMRLDNLVYRLGFTPSRCAARQFVRHGHVLVNGRKASTPSMVLKASAVIGVRSKPASREYAKLNVEATASRGLSPWLSLDKENLRGEVLRVPSREEIAPTTNEQLVVELYSRG